LHCDAAFAELSVDVLSSTTAGVQPSVARLTAEKKKKKERKDISDFAAHMRGPD
jgi:uncharacterized small protein (DUF1192 family)